MVDKHRYNVRRYVGVADLQRMVELVQEGWLPERRPFMHFHIGDLFWRLRDPSYEQSLWLWEEASSGKLAGFVEWDTTAAALETQVHPDFADSDLTVQMLTWAEAQADGKSITTFAAESDSDSAVILMNCGYRRQETTWTNSHFCRLDESVSLESPILPEGYIVRDLHGPEEIEERVRGHRAGWSSTLMTVEKYQRLMQMPGYQRELDLVVVAPDGDGFAATANCWLDKRSGAGLFEPVSTAPAHRRKGLARALVLYGLAQLKAQGAQTAWVGSVSKNPAATALYESCSMSVVRRDFPYSASQIP